MVKKLDWLVILVVVKLHSYAYLVGFYQPTNGKVTIGGYDLNNIPAKNLRDHIGYCGQKVQLFSASIYDNIIAGFSDANEEDVIEAAKLSCAHDFIALLPGGYNYISLKMAQIYQAVKDKLLH